MGSSLKFQGISTQHQVNDLSNLTHCALSADQIRKLGSQGYYYIAVNDTLFGKFNGRACGQVFEVEVGGSCYLAPAQAQDMRCLKDEWHASLEELKSSGINNRIKVVIVDRCSECLDDSVNFHLDILDLAYMPGGSLADLHQFFNRNGQAAKRSDGLTLQPKNLYLKSIEHKGCLSRNQVTGMTKARIESWGSATESRWCE